MHLITASPVLAQGVNYYENIRTPERALDPDREQCNEIARSFVYRKMGWQQPVRMPNSRAGNFLAGLTRVARDASAQQTFDSAFENCLNELGWFRVSPAEMQRRQAKEARDLADARRRAEQDSLDEAAYIAAMKAAPPTVLPPIFNTFDQRTILRTSFAHLPNAREILLFSGAFVTFTPRDTTKKKFAAIAFNYNGEKLLFGSTPELVILINDTLPIRFAADRLRYDQTFVDSLGIHVENANLALDSEEFIRLSTLHSIRGRLGTLEFQVPATHMSVMRELAATLKLRSPAPVVRASPTCSTKRESTGSITLTCK
ncbi:hypothetical protein [Gemmatimonas sp.]|uniref:hypothetical protein n=1 Tax=Gemmatimonas sp. TaxID=1962908 RepID=UPI003563C6E1